MITAKEAYEIAYKYNSKTEEEQDKQEKIQLLSLLTIIKKQAGRGNFSYKPKIQLSFNVRQRLRELGFKVVPENYFSDEWIITWRKQ